MTADTTDLMCPSWCVEHLAEPGDPDPTHYGPTAHVGDVQVQFLSDHEEFNGLTMIEVYAAHNGYLTSGQARELARTLLGMADAAEGHPMATVTKTPQQSQTDAQRVGAILRTCRKRSGLSTTNLAAIAGLTPKRVKALERGTDPLHRGSSMVAFALGAYAANRSAPEAAAWIAEQQR